MSEGRDQLKAVHDLVLATKPELKHEPCPLCDTEEPNMKTYTQEELDAALEASLASAVADAVATATAPLQAELDTLRQAQGATEIDQAVATATAELQATVTALQAQVDEAVANATAAQEAHDALVAAETAKVEAEAIAARKDERVQAVKDLGVWPDEFVDGKGDAYAALTDEAWTEKLDEIEQLRDHARTNGTVLPATRSALTATASGKNKPAESAASRVIRRGREIRNATAVSGN